MTGWRFHSHWQPPRLGLAILILMLSFVLVFLLLRPRPPSFTPAPLGSFFRSFFLLSLSSLALQTEQQLQVQVFPECGRPRAQLSFRHAVCRATLPLPPISSPLTAPAADTTISTRPCQSSGWFLQFRGGALGQSHPESRSAPSSATAAISNN